MLVYRCAVSKGPGSCRNELQQVKSLINTDRINCQLETLKSAMPLKVFSNIIDKQFMISSPHFPNHLNLKQLTISRYIPSNKHNSFANT